MHSYMIRLLLLHHAQCCKHSRSWYILQVEKGYFLIHFLRKEEETGIAVQRLPFYWCTDMSSKLVKTSNGNTLPDQASQPGERPIFLQCSNWRHTFSKYTMLFDTSAYHNCYCDECEKTVVGVRYKCMICKDYDTCRQCVDKHSSTGHSMIRINSPSDWSWRMCYIWSKMDEVTLLQTMSLCCTNRYLRDTYTDEQMQQMDLTQNRGMFTSEQLIESVQKMLNDFYGLLDFVAMSNNNCNECNRVIRGVCLKCITCIHYHLCQDCEKVHEHIKDHAMIRIVNKEDYNWLLPWFLAKTPIDELYLDKLTVVNNAQGSPANPAQSSESMVDNTCANGGKEPKRERRRFPRPSAENIRLAIQIAVGIGSVVAHVLT